MEANAVDDLDLRVLLIEDDPDIARMYKLKLEIDGYSVSVAADGEAGLRQARVEHPDLIFLDVRLPRLDGFHVLEELRAEKTTESIPVVILSNHGEHEQVERGLQLGALEYLIKAETPPARLAADVRKWTGSPY
jgi:DNA-binding response OmpR family regulator